MSKRDHLQTLAALALGQHMSKAKADQPEQPDEDDVEERDGEDDQEDEDESDEGKRKKSKKSKKRADDDADDNGDEDEDDGGGEKLSVADQIIRAGQVRRNERPMNFKPQPQNTRVKATAAGILAAAKKRDGK